MLLLLQLTVRSVWPLVAACSSSSSSSEFLKPPPGATQRNSNMTTKYGVFSETAHGTGDVFVDSVKPDPRDHGLNFKVQQKLLLLLLLLVLNMHYH